MTTDTACKLRTAPVAWARYREDGRTLRPVSRTHLVDVTGAARWADAEILEGSPETLCGAVVPDRWDAEISTPPEHMNPCARCAEWRRKLAGETVEIVSTAELRPRDLRPPANLDTQLARYRALGEIVEARLEGGLVLLEARSVRQTDDGLVAGEILLPRSTSQTRALEVAADLVRLVGAVTRYDLTQDTTGRLRLVVTWDPFPTEETAR